MAVWNEIFKSALPNSLRLDPEYYQPEYFEALHHLQAAHAVPIGSFADVTDGIHGSPVWVEEGEGTTYLSAKTVKDNYITLTAAGQISNAQHLANPRTAARVGDVLLTTVGTIGNAAVVEEDLLPANMDRHLGIIRTQGNVNPYYLATFLNCKYGRFQTMREATGNVQLNLFVDAMKWLLVPTGKAYSAVGDEVKEAYRVRKKSASLYAEAESLLHDALGLDTLNLSHELTYEGRFSDMMDAERMDAQYFHPEKRLTQEWLNAMPGQPIGNYCTSIVELYDGPKDTSGAYVHNYDLTDALRYFLDENDVDPMPAVELGSTKKRFQRGDVVVSRLRSYLKEIAVVETQGELQCVGSTEFIVLRPNDESVTPEDYTGRLHRKITPEDYTGRLHRKITPEVLAVFLRSQPVQSVLKWCQDGSQHPRFKEDEILSLNFPDMLLDIQPKVTQLIREGVAAHQAARELLEEAKRRVEEMILG